VPFVHAIDSTYAEGVRVDFSLKNTKAGKQGHDVCQGIQSDCSNSPDGGWGTQGRASR